VQARGWLSLAVVGIALAIACAASAASPKAALDKKMQAIGTEAQRALFALPPVTGSQTKTEQADNAGRLQAIYARVASRMAALKVPKAIKADFSILVATYRADAGYAGAWRNAILHGSAQDAADASGKVYLNPGNTRLRNAMGRISQHGYYFGTFFH
jgi:hypothetical protein